MNSYELSRNYFDWCFENPEKINPNHTAIYFFAIEHCNRLGWKKKFGFPSQMTMDALGIKKHQTYIKYFNDLCEWGFFQLIEKSKNQYSSNIICLIDAVPKNGKALDKAIINLTAKQTETSWQSTRQSNGSIDKQITINNITNKPDNNKEIFNFKKSLIDFGFQENLVSEWMLVRKNKKATNTKTTFEKFIKEIELASEDKNEILKFIIEKDWKSFEYQWLVNLKNEFNKNQEKQNGQSRDSKSNEQIFTEAMQSEVGKNFRFQ